MLTFVRWQKGESRRCRAFPGLDPGHPAARMACLYCNHLLGGFPQTEEAPAVQLIAIGPVDPDTEELAKFERGGWISAGAVLLHERCANQMDDSELEAFAAELEILPTVPGEDEE